AAMERRDHPELHASYRSDKFALRLPDVLRSAASAERIGGAVSHGMVRRVAGDANAGAVRDSDRGAAVEQPSERAARGHDGSDRDAGCGDAVSAGCPKPRVRTASGGILR